VDRRAFLTSLGAGLLGPLAAEAQPAGKVPRIGILCAVFCRAFSVGLLPEGKAFEDSLSEHGYVDGDSIFLDRRGAGVAYDRLPGYATDLVRRKVDVILAEGWAAVQAAKLATRTIPVVMVAAGDPVETGLVASLARPGGNITGVTLPFGDLLAKQLELLKEIGPGVSHVVVLLNPNNPEHPRALKSMTPAASALGVRLEVVEVRTRGYTELEASVSRTARGRSALLVLDSERAGEVTLFAIKNGLPAVSFEHSFAAAGGLMTYGPNRFDLYRRTAVYLDRILKGASPADLPVQQPTRFDLIINLTTARALGLTVPPSILLRVDQVIE